jgi:FMN phosphatase YigB (HAD superfamily)
VGVRAAAGPRRLPRAPADAGPQAPVALTTDAWYTLLYLSPAERHALASRRRRLWTEPLLAAGLDRGSALALLDRRDRWTRAEEARGRTPPVAEQIERLRRWNHGRYDADGLPGRLDRTVVRSHVRLAPGALEAVRSLADAGLRLAVISNVLNETGLAARAILERLGVLPFFRVVVLSCEHPWAKPSPGPFRLACQFLGAPPARAVHLGDLAYDLDGARAAGMRAWWYVGLRRLNRYLPGQVDPATVPASRVVRSWEELPRRLTAASSSNARRR